MYFLNMGMDKKENTNYLKQTRHYFDEDLKFERKRCK